MKGAKNDCEQTEQESENQLRLPYTDVVPSLQHPEPDQNPDQRQEKEGENDQGQAVKKICSVNRQLHLIYQLILPVVQAEVAYNHDQAAERGPDIY